MKVHGKSRKVYTKERTVEAFQSKQESSQVPTTSRRSLVSGFDFLHDCLFFVGMEHHTIFFFYFFFLKSKKLSRESESVHRVETLYVKDTISKTDEMRNYE